MKGITSSKSAENSAGHNMYRMLLHEQDLGLTQPLPRAKQNHPMHPMVSWHGILMNLMTWHSATVSFSWPSFPINTASSSIQVVHELSINSASSATAPVLAPMDTTFPSWPYTVLHGSTWLHMTMSWVSMALHSPILSPFEPYHGPWIWLMIEM